MANALDIEDLTAGDWQTRLDHIVETMRQTSMHTNPADMVRVYTGRMRNWIRYDRMLSLTRRGVEPPTFLVARDSNRTAEIDPWAQRDQLPRLSGGLLGDLVHGNRARLINDIQISDDDPSAPYIGDLRSLIAVPVFDGGEALNMVIFMRAEPGGFDPQILPQTVWTTNLFGRATHSLTLSQQLARTNEALLHELNTVAELQRGLLPEKLPDIPGLDLAAYYRPATQAGGDYYDFFPLPDGRWGMLIADVSGHGSPAAVLMAITHTLAHTRPAPPKTAGEMLTHLNGHLAARYTAERGLFVTAFFGIYDPARSTFSFAVAGHPAPRVRRCGNGAIVSLEGPVGMPLGIMPGEPYGEATVPVAVGDQIVMYTDGITEAFNGEHEMFGTARLDAALQSCRDADGLIKGVLESLDAFTGRREPDDDRTMVIARVIA